MEKRELIKKCSVLSDYLTLTLIRSCEFEKITHSEFIMLRMLINSEEHNKKLTVTAISDRINISKPAVSQMIRQLEGKNWTERRTDENDRRLVYVCLTREGRTAYEEQLEVIGHSLEESFSDLSTKDLQRLYEVLENIASKVRQK